MARVFVLVELFDVRLDAFQLFALSNRALQLLNQSHVRLERDERMHRATVHSAVYAASSAGSMYVVRSESWTVEIDDVLHLFGTEFEREH